MMLLNMFEPCLIKVLKVLRDGGIIAEDINLIIPSIEVPTGVDFYRLIFIFFFCAKNAPKFLLYTPDIAFPAFVF